jgi:acid phosphatase type 7
MSVSRSGLWFRVGLSAVLSAAVSACGGKSLETAAPVSPTPLGGLIENFTPSAVLVGAGDIAMCGTAGAEATAKLLDNISGTVFAAGDNAYMSGTEGEYRTCYDPTWGRHRSRTRPTPGNHEYRSANAAPYYGYFGAAAGPAGLGYYSYTLGSWLVISLNSETDVSAGSTQVQWLREKLSTSNAKCTAVYWHRPLFSSGPNGSNSDLRDVWRVLYEFNVDVVINGHDHLYERFAPQDPDGRSDPVRGVREFIVGTGGAPVYTTGRAPVANSELNVSTWGVASFTLENGSYRWEFLPAEGSSFHDAGSNQCH